MEKQNHLDDIELAKLKEEELAELIDQADKDEVGDSKGKSDAVSASAGDGKTTFADTDEEKKESD